MKDILTKLVAAWGPSGRESGVAREIAGLVQPFVDKVEEDALGNVIATLEAAKGSGGSPKRVMLSAHMDQACLVITDVGKDGLARFAVIGRLEASTLPGHRVTNRAGVTGVVALEDGVETKDIAAGRMVIDCGATGADGGGGAGFAAGDFLLPATGLAELGGRLSSPALDDRAGCAVLVEVARRLKAADRRPNTIDFVFTTQGAVAPRGARPAAYRLEPDMGLAVDLVPARGAGKAKTQVELGKGPVVRVKENDFLTPPEVRERLLEAGRLAGVVCQFDASSAAEDSTDAQAMEIAGRGLPAGLVGLPARYVRTSSVEVDLADLEGAVKLLVALLTDPKA